MLEEYLATLSFELDDFQIDAIKLVNEQKSVMVAAPTGAGKTIVGEAAIFNAIREGYGKVFYTTPIKALSNQKYNDLVKLYGGEKIGLITGDTVLNSEAQIVVMTTEILRNMQYANSNTLRGLRTVVFDEVHYLADVNRGSVWEEVIIQTPRTVQLIALSATVSNAEEFASWLESVHGECELIISEKRPIELEQFVILSDDSKKGKGSSKLYDLYNQNDSVNEQLIEKMRKPFKKNFKRTNSNRRGNGRSFPNAKKDWGGRLIPSRISVVETLKNNDMLPVIYFVFSRKGCDSAVNELNRSGIDLNSDYEKEQIEEFLFYEVERKVKKEDLYALDYKHFKQSLLKGFAAHHAGVIQIFKECLEKLFEQNLIKVVFATETLALGVNMPARTVVIEKLTKYNGIGMRKITAGEFTQLTGRAGRRGRDTLGFAVVVDDKDISPFDIAALSSKRVYPLISSFMPSYNMAVNLLKDADVVWAKQVLEKSYAQFQTYLKLEVIKMRIEDYQTQIDGFRHYLDFETTGEIIKPNPNSKDYKFKSKWITKYYKISKRIEDEKKEFELRNARLTNEFDKICRVLLKLNYLEENNDNFILTQKGETLSKLNSEHELLLSELIINGCFDKANAKELCAIISSLISVSRTVYFSQIRKTPIDPELLSKLKAVDSKWVLINDLEKKQQINSQRVNFSPNFSLVEAINDHVNDKPLDIIISSFSKDVLLGDFIRCSRNIIDILSQIIRLGYSESLTSKAIQAKALMQTGIIELLDS